MQKVLFVLAFLPLFFISAFADSISEEDSLIFSNQTSYHSLIQIDSDTIALSHAGVGQLGNVTTFDITSDGTITKVNSLQHHNSTAISYNTIIKLDSGIFAIAHGEHGGNGFIKTIDISNDGNISKIGTLKHENASIANYYSMTQLNSNIVVVAFSGLDQDGYIKTCNCLPF